MIRTKLTFVALSLLALTAFAFAVNSTQDGDGKPVQRSDSRWQCEPLVIFDASGGTLLGPCHKNLAVYNNGQVSLSQFSGQPGDNRNVSKRVSPALATELARSLEAAGAFRLTDQEAQVTDVPLTSVTIFRGETNAQAHTFNYWLPQGEYAAIQRAVDNFITRAFPR